MYILYNNIFAPTQLNTSITFMNISYICYAIPDVPNDDYIKSATTHVLYAKKEGSVNHFMSN